MKKIVIEVAIGAGLFITGLVIALIAVEFSPLRKPAIWWNLC